jgi:hypothetical protein
MIVKQKRSSRKTVFAGDGQLNANALDQLNSAGSPDWGDHSKLETRKSRHDNLHPNIGASQRGPIIGSEAGEHGIDSV